MVRFFLGGVQWAGGSIWKFGRLLDAFGLHDLKIPGRFPCLSLVPVFNLFAMR